MLEARFLTVGVIDKQGAKAGMWNALMFILT